MLRRIYIYENVIQYLKAASRKKQKSSSDLEFPTLGFILKTRAFGFGKGQTRVSGSGWEVTYLRSLQHWRGGAP